MSEGEVGPVEDVVIFAFTAAPAEAGHLEGREGNCSTSNHILAVGMSEVGCRSFGVDRGWN